jgi:hypothetical protein
MPWLNTGQSKMRKIEKALSVMAFAVWLPTSMALIAIRGAMTSLVRPSKTD